MRLQFQLFGLFVGIALAIASSVGIARADHQVYLPYAGQTWLAQQIKATQTQVWCVDARAEAYPNFVSQLRETNDAYTRLAGIKNRQVAFTDSACQIKHLMGAGFPCGAGAAACIYYSNSPVLVYYKVELGYTDWRSAQAHELGHGILGQLHERYIDSGGSIQCGGPERGLVVMDCGPPYVRVPMQRDVERGCAVINTSWCGRDATVTCSTTGYDECSQRWRFPDGLSWSPAPAPYGVWYKDDVSIFDGCDLSWGGRHSKAAQGWQRQGSFFFFDALNFGMETPIC